MLVFAAILAFFAKMDTSAGLSSIASLSLGFTMSMRSGDSRMKLPLTRSLVSLSGQRQPQPAHNFHHPADTPVSSSSLHHPTRPRKTSSVYSSVSGRSPSASPRPFSESRSAEKIAEEGSSRDRHVLLNLPSSASMQSVTVDGSYSSSHFQKNFPSGENATTGDDPCTGPLAPGPSCNAARAVDSYGERPSSSVGVNDICIVISDASATDGRRLSSTRASPFSDKLSRSSLADSIDEIGRMIKFCVGTPVNASMENIAADQAVTSAMDVVVVGSDPDPLPSPSSSQVLNGPAPRALSSAGEPPLPRRGQSAKFAAKWLSKIRNSVRRKSLNNGRSVVSSLETDARRKSLFVLSSASTKNGNKVELEHTCRLVHIIYI